MNSVFDDEDGEDDPYYKDKEMSLQPQCHNCKFWWPNLHKYVVRKEGGTCDKDGALTRSGDSCGYWEDKLGEIDWWYFNGDGEES